MGVLLIIIGIALIILSALLMLVKPVLGGLGVIIGILAIVYGRKTKNKPIKTEVKQEIPQVKESKAFTVAGFEHYQNELKSLLKEPTYEYALTGKSFKEEVFGRAYEYEIEWYDAQLVPELENEFDENAIAVYADDVKIGYVARKDQQAVIEGKYEVEIYGGKYKELEIDEYENEKIIKGETPYKARLYIEN